VVIAVTLLGENFEIFHALGIGMIAVGIWLAMFVQKQNIPV
jgi:drug/metabolite transporter (DMT)-like permease